MITRVDQYSGEEAIRIFATQLGTDYTAYQAKKVVDQWCEFFQSGPSPIRSLAFTSRTPRRLFASLHPQSQLVSLAIKWGDYDDLRAVASMTGLQDLWLGGAVRVSSLTPLESLAGLRRLCIEGLRDVRDLSPVGKLVGLESLELGGNWMSPRIAHIDSIGFLRDLTQLSELILHTIVVDDLDYSPVLALNDLAVCQVALARGMKPSHDELSRQIPALEPIAQ